MIHLINKKRPDDIMVIAESKTDMDFLRLLYDTHIVFGQWKIYDKENDKSRSSNEYKFLQKNYPLAYGLCFIAITGK